MTIQKVYKMMKSIEDESSKTGKEKLLKQYKDDKDFREVLEFLLNPFIVTGISTKKINKEFKGVNVRGFIPNLPSLIQYLKTHNTGRDEDILWVQTITNSKQPEEIQDFLKKLVTKDLKLGISEKTVNKVYGKGTIPSFAVQLAESYAKKEAKVTGKFYITLKLDGNRCVAIVEDKSVKFFTRKGQPIEGMEELTNQFLKLPNGAYDGELLLINKDNLPSDELFRATQKVVRKDGVKKDLEFHIFDYLPIKEFYDGKSKKVYEQRRNTLELIFSNIEEKIDNIHLLPVLYSGTDKSMIGVLMKWAEENKYEGLMINTADGLYVNKRTDNLLKVKKFTTADLIVVSLEKAIDGQFKGLMGRVNVEYKGNLVGVGSGFTLDERRLYADNPDLIIGKVIEVQYFEESKDEKTEMPSLRFPVFKGIRDDKTIEDVNYE